LAIGTLLASAVLAGASYLSAADTVALGLAALPAMLKHNYNKEILLEVQNNEYSLPYVESI
jgi:TRAP-type mannitol/chloroaromatic compound transport system permease large subunit